MKDIKDLVKEAEKEAEKEIKKGKQVDLPYGSYAIKEFIEEKEAEKEIKKKYGGVTKT